MSQHEKKGGRHLKEALTAETTDDKAWPPVDDRELFDEVREYSIAVLFLASGGIAQPTLWQEWLSESRFRERIHFFVHGPAAAENLPSAFWQPGFIPGGSTQGTDQALTLQTCCRLILTRQPAIAMIYLVSGADIPLRAASHLYQLPVTHTLYARTSRTFLEEWKGNDEALRECIQHIASLPEAPADLKIDVDAHFVNHSTWLALTGAHALVLANFPLQLLNPLRVRNKLVGGSDSFAVLSALLLSGVPADEFHNTILNDCWRTGQHTGDIIWRTFTVPSAVWQEQGSECHYNLLQAIKEAQGDTESFFLRSIAPEAELSFQRLDWKPWHSFGHCFVNFITNAPEEDDDGESSDDDDPEREIDLDEYEQGDEEDLLLERSQEAARQRLRAQLASSLSLT